MSCCGTRKMVVAKVAMLLSGVDQSPGRASLPTSMQMRHWGGGAACHHSQTPLQSLTQNETRTFCIACREEIWHMIPARFDSKWESSRSTI